MDISLKLDDYILNIKAAGIIMHNNKILFHRNIRGDHYALLGGRVKIGENSEDTIKREIKEELGKEIEISGYISTIENFFEKNGSKYHEIMFVYKVEFVNEEDKKIQATLNNVEGEDYIIYEWLDIDDLNNYSIRPNIIKEVLKSNNLPVHKLNIEI